MSKLVIINHVKEGEAIAKRFRLNSRIIDFIRQHHGTSLVYYFYRRALENKEEEDNFADIENTVLETIKNIEGENGASWDLITSKCKKAGLDKDSIEEALNSLMDKGLIYEPVLGTIKTT